MQSSLSHTIYQKLQNLVKEYEQLKKENQRLQQELEQQRMITKDGLHKTEILEGQLALLKSSAGQMDAEGKKQMERRINQYIKDIDTAITLLNE